MLYGVIGSVLAGRGASRIAPSAGVGVSGPSPVAKIETFVPALAGLADVLSVPSSLSASACVLSHMKTPGAATATFRCTHPGALPMDVAQIVVDCPGFNRHGTIALTCPSWT